MIVIYIIISNIIIIVMKIAFNVYINSNFKHKDETKTQLHIYAPKLEFNTKAKV